MVFPENDYDTSGALAFSNGQYTFTHKAYGADKFRYSWNFGKNWTVWQNWEDTTTINSTVIASAGSFWQGDHIMVQCEQ
jgi:alpha-1,3-glucan synthase